MYMRSRKSPSTPSHNPRRMQRSGGNFSPLILQWFNILQGDCDHCTIHTQRTYSICKDRSVEGLRPRVGSKQQQPHRNDTSLPCYSSMPLRSPHTCLNVPKRGKDKRLCILSLQKIVCFILFHYSSEQAIVKPVTTKQTILLRCRFVIVCIIFGGIQLCDQ